MTKSVEIAAHYNVDANMVKVQLYVVDECDNLMHWNTVDSGTIQLFNVYTKPETGLQEVPLELVSFDRSLANEDGFFTAFFLNPAVNTRLEARASVTIANQGIVSAITSVLRDEGTYTDQPSSSVVGSAVNKSWHLDLEPDRDSYRQDESPHDIPELSDNQTIIPDPVIVNPLYADIQFEQLAELKTTDRLSGSLTYLGGGNRLLPRPGVLVFQPTDTPPWELGASTFVEQTATELLPNNQFLTLSNSGVPSGYGILDSSGITILQNIIQNLQSEGFEARAWTLKMNGAVPASINPFNTASIGSSELIPFDASKPLSMSILAGMQKDTGDTSISSAKLIFTFYDFADRQLTSMAKILDVDELFNARPLKPFSIYAHLSDYPPTAEKVSWKLEIGSMEQGDYVTLVTALPSMTQTPFATSEVLSEQTRLKDNLTYAPETPFALQSGAVVLSLAIGFEGAPTEERYFFDSRTSPGLENGAALRVEPTGELTLIVADSSSSVSVTSSTAPEWKAGAVTEIVAEWSAAAPLLRISVDGEIVAEDSITPLPAGVTSVNIPVVYLGSDANVTKHIDSEFIRAVFLKRPRS